MTFRKIRNVRLSYERQGQIYFTLANYHSQPDRVRQKIDGMIQDVTKGEKAYTQALRAWLLDGKTYESVVRQYYVRGNTLVRMRKELYEMW